MIQGYFIGGHYLIGGCLEAGFNCVSSLKLDHFLFWTARAASTGKLYDITCCFPVLRDYISALDFEGASFAPIRALLYVILRFSYPWENAGSRN